MAKREHKTPKKKFHIGDITKIQDKNGFLQFQFIMNYLKHSVLKCLNIFIHH